MTLKLQSICPLQKVVGSFLCIAGAVGIYIPSIDNDIAMSAIGSGTALLGVGEIASAILTKKGGKK